MVRSRPATVFRTATESLHPVPCRCTGRAAGFPAALERGRSVAAGYFRTPAPVVVGRDVGRFFAEDSRPAVRVGVQLTVVLRSLEDAAL